MALSKTQNLPCIQCVNSCYDAKTTKIAAVIVAALAAIAVVGSVLFLLASQGVNLGPLNTIALNMGPGAIYGMLIGSGIVLLLDIGFIITLVCKSLKNTSGIYSDKEFKKLGIKISETDTRIANSPMEYIQSYHIPDKMHDSTYYVMTIDITDNKQLWAIVTKDDQRVCRVSVYKNNKFFDRDIESIQKDKVLELDDEYLFYPLEFIKKIIPNAQQVAQDIISHFQTLKTRAIDEIDDISEKNQLLFSKLVTTPKNSKSTTNCEEVHVVIQEKEHGDGFQISYVKPEAFTKFLSELDLNMRHVQLTDKN